MFYARGNSPPTSQNTSLFVSGLERIEQAGGGCLRFVFYEMHMVDGETVRVRITPDIVMPIDALPDGIGKAMMALGRQVIVRPDGSMSVAH